jgi:cytidine deaminase
LSPREVGVHENEINRLVAAASVAREQAYAPYSHMTVGAAVRGAPGEVYTGCNVENASYGLTICAERNAVAQAVAQGARQIEAIAVVSEEGVSPCGACRQVLMEFNPDMLVITADAKGQRKMYRLSELLPQAFDRLQLPSGGRPQP